MQFYQRNPKISNQIRSQLTIPNLQAIINGLANVLDYGKLRSSFISQMADAASPAI